MRTHNELSSDLDSVQLTLVRLRNALMGITESILMRVRPMATTDLSGFLTGSLLGRAPGMVITGNITAADTDEISTTDIMDAALDEISMTEGMTMDVASSVATLAVEVTGERGFAVNTASEAENLVAKASAVANLTAAVVVSAVKVASEAENHMEEDSVVANLTAVAAGMAENHTAVDIGKRYFN